MAEYIVSARKYRPDTFESLIGQDNIARTLKNSIIRGQLAHAYLFCGPRGVGKTSTARIFAKAINCSNPGEGMEPCGECESCLSFKEGRSYCIHELDAASNNGVEDIKALMDKVQIPPQVGRYSVYIIDEVHMLSSSAFNAFLKTLEEPPAHAIFILCTTEKHKIIPTILSRCQTYDFNRISIPDIVRNLKDIAAAESISIDDESLHMIADKADGAMRDALTIFDQTVAFCGTEIKAADVMRNLNVLDYEFSFRLVDAFLKGDYAAAFLIFDEILKKGFNSLYFISALGSHFRDLLVSRTGGLESLLNLPDSLKARYAAQSASCSVKFIFDALDIISKCEAGYRASTNQRLHIEYALMRLSFINSAPSAQASAPAVPQPARQQQTIQAAPAAVPANAAAAVQTANAAVAARPAEAAASGKAEAAISMMEEPAPVQSPSAAPEPVRAPATTPASAPEAAEPQPRPRARKGGASLSLAALTKDEDTAAVADNVKNKPEAPHADAPSADFPSDEALAESWKKLAAHYQESKPRLSNTLSSAKLSFSAEGDFKLVSFEVTNEGQKKWIEEKLLRELESCYNSLAGTTKVRLGITVMPDEEIQIVNYLPAEKAKDLIDRNENVREFVKDFHLDTK